jgi:hypothetical protein
MGSCQMLALSHGVEGTWPESSRILRELKVALRNKTLSKLGGGPKGTS